MTRMNTTDRDKAEDAIEMIWALGILIPAAPFLIGYFFALAVVQGMIKLGRLLTTGRIHPRPQPASSRDLQMSPRYRAHGSDGSIIGEYDTIEDCEIAGLMADCEIAGLMACGVKVVDLPLALHERRRLGTYGCMYKGSHE